MKTPKDHPVWIKYLEHIERLCREPADPRDALLRMIETAIAEGGLDEDGPPWIEYLRSDLQDEMLRKIGTAIAEGLDRYNVFSGIFGERVDSIERLAWACLALRERLTGGGRSRQGMALIAYLCTAMLFNCAIHDIATPPVLLLLCGLHFGFLSTQVTSQHPGGLLRAIRYTSQNPKASDAEIAKATDNDRRTVRHWRAAGVLESGIYSSSKRRKPTEAIH